MQKVYFYIYHYFSSQSRCNAPVYFWALFHDRMCAAILRNVLLLIFLLAFVCVLLKMGHPDSFSLFSSISLQLTVKKCSILKFANDWIRTADIWSRKLPVCVLFGFVGLGEFMLFSLIKCLR